MITSVLVANRGEIARRIFRTCRARGLGTVAVFSDADAGSPHVAEADAAVRLPGAAPADTYLRGDLIIAAAQRAGADAIHPGYGFLSENAAFAQSVIDAGLVWIGPPPSAIEAMGSKVSAKRLMADAGVPVLPSLDPAAIRSEDLPVLIKASAGGGGRGMRVVSDISELSEAVATAEREAASAFGDATVFCERYLPAGHHVEVQVLADRHGTVWALGERECSLQRRHQKVIEEAPSPLVEKIGGDLRKRLLAAGRDAAAAVGYVGAGTVEFLASDDGEFWFLEMNTRLQVEHPVTEAVTGVDLVALQLDVAAGRRLTGPEPEMKGHAIEARLYAESPLDDWRPQTGTLAAFTITADSPTPSGRPERHPAPGNRAELPLGVESASGRPERHPAPGNRAGLPLGVRVDSGVEAGSVVGPHYDAMLAKVIFFAGNREDAARGLASALRRARIHGVVTNRDLLVGSLLHPSFLDSTADTSFYRVNPPASLIRSPDAGLFALVAAVSDAAAERGPLLPGVTSGFRNIPVGFRSRAYAVGDHEIEVRYRFTRDGLQVDGDLAPVLVEASADEVVLDLGGVRRRWSVGRFGVPGADGGNEDRVVVDGADGSVELRVVARFADPADQMPEGALIAPMPGTVVRVGVEVGEKVTAGQPLVWLEAMKMEHAVRAPKDGTVSELPVTLGQQVGQGTPLAVVDD